MNLRKFISFSCLFANVVRSHIQMRDPPPRRSKYSSYYVSSGLVDYNLMAPINAGYSFPCKGYSSGPVTKTISGNTVSISLEGTATHGGGHCQFGISTDDKTFLVLKTVIRECLITSMSYSFNLPNNLPNTKVTVFWTWVNAIGNREYYMDCADVQLTGSAEQTTVNGKSLLVLNLPGYQTIPEFALMGMYDGRELFESRADISFILKKNGESSIVSPPIPSQPQPQPPQPEPQPQPQPPIQGSNCEHGKMTCGKDNGFNTCVHGQLIWRACAPGTKCKEVNDSIVCDFI